jgi:hypothetical protein
MNYLKEDEKISDSNQGNNNSLNNLIMNNNTSIVTFNRKKNTISPLQLQTQKDKLLLNNNNYGKNLFLLMLRYTYIKNLSITLFFNRK